MLRTKAQAREMACCMVPPALGPDGKELPRPRCNPDDCQAWIEYEQIGVAKHEPLGCCGLIQGAGRPVMIGSNIFSPLQTRSQP